jgi:predicted peptidase
MRLLRGVILTAALAALTRVGSLAGGAKDSGTKDAATKDPTTKDPIAKLVDKHFEKDKTTFDYLLYLPPGYEKGDKSWPLVLFLHGKGDKIERLRRAGLPRRIEQKKEAFLLVAPQQSGKKGWSAAAVGALLDDVVANHKVDKDRVYVTGLSMGGFGAWSLATAYPDKFAAIIPICGGGNPANAKKIKDLPIWVFHGAKDQVVPASRSEAMVKALKDAGAENVKFTLYPNAGHDAWTATYSNQEVWDWLLKQKRGGK